MKRIDEPKELKRMIKELSKVLGKGEGRGGSRGVLIYNKLPQYIWSVWGDDLKKQGITWREFLGILSKNSNLVAEWAISEGISWDELLGKLEESLVSYSKAGVERRQMTLDRFITGGSRRLK